MSPVSQYFIWALLNQPILTRPTGPPNRLGHVQNGQVSQVGQVGQVGQVISAEIAMPFHTEQHGISFRDPLSISHVSNFYLGNPES